jgi:hypothetical protein
LDHFLIQVVVVVAVAVSVVVVVVVVVAVVVVVWSPHQPQLGAHRYLGCATNLGFQSCQYLFELRNQQIAHWLRKNIDSNRHFLNWQLNCQMDSGRAKRPNGEMSPMVAASAARVDRIEKATEAESQPSPRKRTKKSASTETASTELEALRAQLAAVQGQKDQLMAEKLQRATKHAQHLGTTDSLFLSLRRRIHFRGGVV